MFYVIYQSKDITCFSEKDLKALLVRSRFRNASDGVTGVLLLHGGTFLQALEGKEAVVMTTFARIEQDDRHHEVRKLSSGRTRERRRIFGEWSMGFANASETTRMLSGYVETRDLPDLSGLNPPMAMNILRRASESADLAPMAPQ